MPYAVRRGLHGFGTCQASGSRGNHRYGTVAQVSASEAGEPKRLLVLRTADWGIEESLPLSLGRRHFTFSCDPAALFLACSKAGGVLTHTLHSL
jgi:hypothetical protein